MVSNSLIGECAQDEDPTMLKEAQDVCVAIIWFIQT